MNNTRTIKITFGEAKKIAKYIKGRKSSYTGRIFNIKESEDEIYSEENERYCECYTYLEQDSNGNPVKDENGKRVYKTVRSTDDIPDYVNGFRVITDYNLLPVNVETDLSDFEIKGIKGIVC